ncbi:MAG: acetoin:2,6-dichlorophenolindophenol oxidoreductase subunit alpha [Thermomicrobiales bacterium]|jgi:pyruvate dehydrogenase E1 component alpha subunit|nr:acetoin:2,6-dichlorophenolindophenol oxidoreductase subunit alpha [Thermomicrobiales bacterium]MEA2523544.1 acetoin:2,6-dichlorophenolindophenol oxidoreductase subunit alpha [Thermomicrobiales bacterium]MEA2586830.1 acetoin:2,6-dichlorophenolindophenol oxidoreductase subunit alpha [Thermomicrobiales bacterium]
MSIAESPAVAGIDRAKLLEMYERMVQIRTFEDAAGKNFADGLIPGFVHLYAGEEAIAVGVCSHLSDKDFITSTHRGHGHCIAKGVDIPGMVAELMGKATGVCKGKGGSMHIADVDKGMLGANGIVGGGFPLACGAALTAKTLGTGGVAICFFGDGASNQGTFHEGLNLAAIWNLPVVFVCENNGYAESTPVSYHCAASDIANRAASYEIPGVVVDGLDLFSVYEVAGEAIARARRGEGPTLIEAKTYRFYGHFQGDMVTYRTQEELDRFKLRDPILSVRAYGVQHGLATPDEFEAIDARVQRDLDTAWGDAKTAPWPAPEEALTDVYVTY